MAVKKNVIVLMVIGDLGVMSKNVVKNVKKKLEIDARVEIMQRY